MAPPFKDNAVLCYITSARGSLNKDNIIGNVVAFYSSDVIFSAKEEIFEICKERPIRRKATAEFPNASVPNVRDILQLIDQVEGKIELPSFVATNYNSLPPSNFDSLAPVLCSLRDEITTLREEVSQGCSEGLRIGGGYHPKLPTDIGDTDSNHSARAPTKFTN